MARFKITVSKNSRALTAAFYFLCTSGAVTAQSYAESKMVFISEDKYSKAIEYHAETSVMSLNLSTGDFALTADFSDLKTGDRKLDSLLKQQGEQLLLFKGNIGENVLTYAQQQNDEQTYNMPGQITFNGNTFAGIAQFDPVNLADKSESRNYRMDLRLALDPDKLAIKVLDGRFAKQIVLEITGGKLNIQN